MKISTANTVMGNLGLVEADSRYVLPRLEKEADTTVESAYNEIAVRLPVLVDELLQILHKGIPTNHVSANFANVCLAIIKHVKDLRLVLRPAFSKPKTAGISEEAMVKVAAMSIIQDLISVTRQAYLALSEMVFKLGEDKFPNLTRIKNELKRVQDRISNEDPSKIYSGLRDLYEHQKGARPTI